MRLTTPTDFTILEVMTDGKRQTPGNLAHVLNLDNTYVSGRIQELLDARLVERVSPQIKHGGMYVITQKGRVTASRRDVYDRDFSREFGDVIDRIVAFRSEHEISTNDVAVPSAADIETLSAVNQAGGEFTYEANSGDYERLQALYRLTVYRCVNRDGLTFAVTPRGEQALALWQENDKKWGDEELVTLNQVQPD